MSQKEPEVYAKLDRFTGQATVRYAPLLLATTLVFGLLALWVGRYFMTTLGHDQVSYLFEAERFLAGNQIYGPHLSETNPPVIIWLSTIPVMLAQRFSLSTIIIFRSLILLIMCFSAAWSLSLLSRGGTTTGRTALGLYGICVIAVELSIGAFDFGQREHLVIILLLPYLLSVATGTVARLSFVERGALGIAAGYAIWFKPQDVLIVIALELACALRSRSVKRLVSTDFTAMVLTALFCFMLVLVLTPLYLYQVVPLLSDVYWALGTNTFVSLVLGSHRYFEVVFSLILCCFWLRQRLRDWTTPVVLLICSIAGQLVYALQHTIWPYHQYPYKAIFLIALSYLLLDICHPLLSKADNSGIFQGRRALALSGFVLIMVVLVAIHPAIARYRMPAPVSTPLDLFLNRVEPGTVVSALSTSVPVLAAVYDHGLKWGSRFAHLWMLPAIIQNEIGTNSRSKPFKELSPQAISRLAALQREEVAEDLTYWHPALVLIPHCTRSNSCQGMDGEDFDVLSWFERSSTFAKVWSHYEQQQGISGYDVYRLAR